MGRISYDSKTKGIRRVMVFRSFPEAYDADMTDKIKKICMSAESSGTCVVSMCLTSLIFASGVCISATGFGSATLRCSIYVRLTSSGMLAGAEYHKIPSRADSK